MAGSQEPSFTEAIAQENTDAGPSSTGDIEMAEHDLPLIQDHSIADTPSADLSLSGSNLLDLTEAHPSMSDDTNMMVIDQPLDLGDTSPAQPAVETAPIDAVAPDITEYMPSMTDDLDMLEDFATNDEPLPKIEPVPSPNDPFQYPDANPIVSHDASPVESFRPLDLGQSSLGERRSENAFSDENAHNVAPAASQGTNDISSTESTHDAAHSHVSPDKNAGDASTQSSSARPIDLGHSSLGKPKKAPNVESSSVRTAASQSVLDKAKAMQARFARQFAEKQTAKVPNAPSSGLSASGAGESATSVVSDIFVPPEFSEDTAIHPEEAEFEVIKAAHLLKKNAGTSDIESDIAFLKIEAREMARKRKVVADERYERESSVTASEDEGLFVTPSSSTPASHAPVSSEDGNVHNAFFTTISGKGRKRKAGGTAAMAPPSKKRTKKTKAPTGRSLGAGKGGKGLSEEDVNRTLSALQSGSTQAVAGKTTKTGRQPVHDLHNYETLFTGTDVFRDAAAVAGHSSQPGFRPGHVRKDFALKDLIASVPQDERPAAAGDKKFLEESLKNFDGQGSCKPSADGLGWTLKGMRCTMKHYQVLGVAFMRKRENHEGHPRGGILADEMGLGKTIQMLANIINGKPKPGQPRTTLIVASPALISQWFAEITKFVIPRSENKKHGIARVIQHRAGYKQGGDEAQVRAAIMESDICLTTYSQINKSYPKAEVPAEITTERGKAEWWRQHFKDNKGVFHDMKFLRIVLDEAQAIKNHLGHCSRACRALEAEYYWAISGTPLVNGVTEMYPYLKFLRHPHVGSMRTFQANFCSPNDPTGSEKLGVFLRQIIIRRTHQDLLFGARLLNLPTPKEHVANLEFNVVERAVYEIVKQRFIQRINSMTRRDGTLSQSQQSHVWTLLLRLRQICSHVLLIQETMMELLEREDFEKLNTITRELKGQSQETDSMLLGIRHMLQVHSGARREVPEGSAAVPGASNTIDGPATTLGNKHGKSYDFQKYLDSAAESEQMEAVVAREKCCSCRLKPVNPQITDCSHIYCKGCLRTLQHAAARVGRPARCCECNIAFQSVNELPSRIQIDNGETDASRTSGESQKGSKGKGKKKHELDWIGQPGSILPSAKTIACKLQILEWFKEAPTCKILVYTQFLPMLRIMGRVCQGEGWGHLKYSGIMSHTAREHSLREFATDPSKKIMLMSLKAGGLGLNITAASRVILLDPWWNNAVEQQAFCRVFRIGQKNETRLTRLCIKNSMDSAMFAIKERKTVEIEKVMEESRPGPCSTSELLRLFGPVGEDEDGRPGFIFPDQETNADGNEGQRFYEYETGNDFFSRGQREGRMGNDI